MDALEGQRVDCESGMVWVCRKRRPGGSVAPTAQSGSRLPPRAVSTLGSSRQARIPRAASAATVHVCQRCNAERRSWMKRRKEASRRAARSMSRWRMMSSAYSIPPRLGSTPAA